MYVPSVRQAKLMVFRPFNSLSWLLLTKRKVIHIQCEEVPDIVYVPSSVSVFFFRSRLSCCLAAALSWSASWGLGFGRSRVRPGFCASWIWVMLWWKPTGCVAPDRSYQNWTHPKASSRKNAQKARSIGGDLGVEGKRTKHHTHSRFH